MRSLCLLLTEASPGPPMWLLDCDTFNLFVEAQFPPQVCRARLGLPNDQEVG